MIIVCVGGGFNVIGVFVEFIFDKEVKLIGVEVVGKGLNIDRYVVIFILGIVDVLDGMKIYVLFNEDGFVKLVYLIFFGLDYLGIGLEYVFLRDSKRVEYVFVIDDEVVNVFLLLIKKEGIIFVIESFYVLVEVIKRVFKLNKNKIIIVNIFGCGDKDVVVIVEYLKNK